METKVRRGPKYRTTAITYRGSARDCWDVMAAYWGCQRDHARKQIAKAQGHLADVITQAHRNNREDWVRNVFARLDMMRPGLPMDHEPWLLAAVAKLDGKEDGSLAELLANPECRDAMRRWVADAEAEVQAKQEAIYAVKTALGAS
jgi:hypothetical protein